MNHVIERKFLPFYLRDKVALKTHEREQAKLDAAAARIAS
jgi:hypothetical protein